MPVHLSTKHSGVRYKFDFYNYFCEVQDRPKVVGWLFLGPLDAVSKQFGDEKSNLSHVTEGP